VGGRCGENITQGACGLSPEEKSISRQKCRLRAVGEAFDRLRCGRTRRAFTARRAVIAFGARFTGFTRRALLTGFTGFTRLRRAILTGTAFTRATILTRLARFVGLGALAFEAGTALAIGTEAVATVAAATTEFVVTLAARAIIPGPFVPGPFVPGPFVPGTAIFAIALLRTAILARLEVRLVATFAGMLVGAGLELLAVLVVVEIGIVAEALLLVVARFRRLLMGWLHGAQDTIVVLGVLEIAFRHHPVAGRVRVTRQLEILFVDGRRRSTDLDVGAVALERAIGLMTAATSAATARLATAPALALLMLHM
jgi:hypothetical protein